MGCGGPTQDERCPVPAETRPIDPLPTVWDPDSRVGDMLKGKRGLVVGIANAVDLCYSGRLISAAEAQEKGLVQSVHAPGALIDAAIAKAREMTEHSAPVSVALTRHMLWRMMGAPHPMSAHRWDSRVIFSRGRSPDAAEGVTSFLEKRAPHFTASVANDYPWFDEFEESPPYG